MSVQMEQEISIVPAHLRQFVVEQHYENYTAVNQAVWRFVMRQNKHYLGQRAHHAYLNGLRESGIGIDSIPNIQYMSQCLSRIGWSAVTVDGFIPPEAFMDFQAHRILAIAADIRTLDHVAYTPAPDIIHEAAGHAPIILDQKYRSYLQLIGEVGAKAFSSKADHEVYEAIRLLSIVKEDPTATADQIETAETELERAVKAVTETSEAAMVSRLYWWTVEYGLIGDVKNPAIYGAGLLSSVGESISCMQEDVKKIPFDLETCIQTSYDITKPQPQLFVCRDFDQLIEAVHQLEKQLAFRIGGTYALKKAVESCNTATVVYSSGLQVSGTFSELVYDGNGEAIYLKTAGPTALALNNRELAGHGKEYHNEGFGSPIGRLADMEAPLEELSDSQLADIGIQIGSHADLHFASGIEVRGIVRSVVRENGKILLISLDKCTVTYRDKTLCQAEWGLYDMAVGASIVSAYPGAADKERFQSGTHQPSKLKTKKLQLDVKEQKRNALYKEIRDLRTSLEGNLPDSGLSMPDVEEILVSVDSQLETDFPDDWLLRLEILEIMTEQSILPELQARLGEQLQEAMNKNADLQPLIANGLALLRQERWKERKRMKLTEEENAANLPRIPNWQRLDEKWIQRKYKFPGFLDAMAFVNKVAELAEAADHHPFISIDYKVVTLKMSSWNAGGLTELDFNLAEQFDASYSQSVKGRTP
ncbi:aromatic amino acid hydroxylase [Effusibacillus consociatus]|uniref:4a-hydroxytetrahydrobiopterin dehydratase n=1 Tax=Effusibacillus consociatus TaxID=1117041 RepID=A0ABV9Q2T3_9BACL